MSGIFRLGDRSRVSGDVHARFSEGLGVKLPRATQLVVLCRTRKGARKALEWIKFAMETMGLSLNREKTKIANANVVDFDFLGYTFGRRYPKFTGRRYLAATPSDAS